MTKTIIACAALVYGYLIWRRSHSAGYIVLAALAFPFLLGAFTMIAYFIIDASTSLFDLPKMPNTELVALLVAIVVLLWGTMEAPIKLGRGNADHD
jgi:hypothetical protein